MLFEPELIDMALSILKSPNASLFHGTTRCVLWKLISRTWANKYFLVFLTPRLPVVGYGYSVPRSSILLIISIVIPNIQLIKNYLQGQPRKITQKKTRCPLERSTRNLIIYQYESSSHSIHQIVTVQPSHLQLSKNGQCLRTPAVQVLQNERCIWQLCKLQSSATTKNKELKLLLRNTYFHAMNLVVKQIIYFKSVVWFSYHLVLHVFPNLFCLPIGSASPYIEWTI